MKPVMIFNWPVSMLAGVAFEGFTVDQSSAERDRQTPQTMRPIQDSSQSFLKGLDYSVLQQCMHCGLCLPTCPTYDATQLERNSPRGRISLMRAIADDELDPSKSFADEMYFCLGCLACMTACPAGVNYAELFERARAEAERVKVLANPRRSLIRKVTLGWLFTRHSRLEIIGRLIRLYQVSGFQEIIRRSGLLWLLPKRLRELEAMTPKIEKAFSAERIAEVTPAANQRKYRVALLTGCAQDLIFSSVNVDTAEVLRRNNCEVFTPKEQTCCGSLHAHNGEWELAQQQARRNIDQFPPESFDAIISNAAGCGSHLKHYSGFFKGDPDYATKAKLWDTKVKDIHEWLAEIGFRAPSASSLPSQSVSYHDACHLCHGQKITQQPRDLLKSIPNLTLTELPESQWCCGSAGIYNIVQPEMANELLERKLNHIEQTGASTIATGNPGCLLQIQNGTKQRGLKTRIAHPISLLAEAYRSEDQ